MSDEWILTLSCADRVGIVAGVSRFLADHDGFIVDSQQYADLETDRFFMRVRFVPRGERFPPTARMHAAFAPVAAALTLDWTLTQARDKPRAVVAVSRGSHCLADLLHRQASGALAMDMAAVVSNHDNLRAMTEWHGLPFHHLPVHDASRPAQEAAILSVMEESGADYLILARYMQVLSPDLVERLAGRCINIHHSFLPGFKGARPYHRAHARGVKLIGATAHFVTSELDEGPIVEQAVERVDHRDSVDDMIRIGRDIESRVLSRAVDAVGARRVFLNDGKTVIFR